MKRIIALTLAASLATASAATAMQIPFNSGWKEQKFSLFSKNRYSFGGSTLGVTSDGAVSMAYTAVPEKLWGANSASWKWSVDQSVPATDLRKKGGDDRNLAMYVVFLPQADAQASKGAGIRSLLSNQNARVLVYVWGGDHGRGKLLSSPYLGNRGKTVVLRDAGTGSHAENVNLAADYKRAFGGSKGAVVGIAVSADSDDTDSKIKGAIGNLSLQ
ncbi:MAG: DUF3047 domain-containing protein [Pseudomonadota bacterium]